MTPHTGEHVTLVVEGKGGVSVLCALAHDLKGQEQEEEEEGAGTVKERNLGVRIHTAHAGRERDGPPTPHAFPPLPFHLNERQLGIGVDIHIGGAVTTLLRNCQELAGGVHRDGSDTASVQPCHVPLGEVGQVQEDDVVAGRGDEHVVLDVRDVVALV